jgi:hypothetical protein
MSDEEKDPDPIEFEAELRRYGRAEPFSPFEIILTSGDRVLVNNSDNLAFTGNAIVFADPRQGIRVFRKNQVVGFHVHEPAV